VQPLIDEKGHRLSISLPPGPIWLDGDAIRLTQVIGNILQNSAKYTEPAGHIWLTCEREAGSVAIHIRDDGVGMDASLLPRIFDLFTQADRAIDRSQGGLGIGLTLVRTLVEMHGGTVEVWSAGPGQGSEFVVRLPTLEVSDIQRLPAWKPNPVPPCRVLVVEDNVGSAKVLARTLSRFWGHEVELAHNGLEALEMASTFRPALVLLDIGLPGISGYEVAQRLRAQPQFQGTLLVALTGYGQAEDRRRSREAGIDEHLVKPASVEILQTLFTHPKLTPADKPS
jgi:two-component system CheB/CheR fusion protein